MKPIMVLMEVHPLILAILREARSQGIAPMLRTALIKYLYLLDVYTAEETKGTPISDVEWRFLHFGPFSAQVAHAMDELATQRAILTNQRETQTGNKEFVLYDLPRHQQAQDLRGLGVSGSIQMRIHADMKRYGKDLSRLLDFTYFHTTPMADAQPGDILDFSSCIKMIPEDVRPVEMQKLRQKAIKKTRTKLRKLIQSRKAVKQTQQGPFDETYFSALSMLNGEPIETGFTGRAKLKI